MNWKTLNPLKLIILVIFSLFIVSSCSDDNSTDPTTDAPTLPPQSTMVMDFNSFPDTTSPALKKINADTTRLNWGWAALNVGFWNSVIFVTLAIPVNAFGESFNHEPTQQPDGSWLWTYDVNVGSNVFTAKLYGRNVSEGVEWEMYLTKAGAYTDFLWFTGESNLTATEGSWTLNKDPQEPKQFLLINWSRDTQNTTASVRYTNILLGDPNEGNYIQYGKTTDVTYNRFYDLYDSSTTNSINIQWNFKAKFGRVMDALNFGDPFWHCWDEQLFDTQCPN